MIKEVKEETQSKRNLKHLLILLSRILAIAALVFAFAQPYIPAKNVENIAGQKAVSVFIDNSFSMDANNEEGNLLQQAKDQAITIANSYEQSDLFQLLTNDFEGRHQRLLNREDFLKLIDEVDISPNSKKLSEVIARQQDLLLDSDAQGKRAFLISDFQKSFIGNESIASDTLIRYNFKPIAVNESPNIYIDSIWFESPVRQLNQNEQLTVRVVNNSSENYENLQLNLDINGVQKAISSIDLEPGTVADTSLYFRNSEAGSMSAVVSVEDYPIVYDDKMFFSYDVAEKVNVLVINENGQNDLPSRVFGNDEIFDLGIFDSKRIDFNEFEKASFIVLNGLNTISSGLGQEIRKFLENGGSIVHFPGVNCDLNNTNEFLLSLGVNTLNKKVSNSLKVSDILLEHPLFKDVFERIPRNVNLPEVAQFYPISRRSLSTEQKLLSLQDGSSFLSAYNSGKGQVYSFAVPASTDFSNLPKHALFVTCLLRMAELSQNTGTLYFTIGNETMTDEIKASISGDQVVHFFNPNTNYDIIPEKGMNGNKTAFFFQNQISEADNYEVRLSEQQIGSISFNYPRNESELSYFSSDELEQSLKESGIKNFQILNKNVKDLSRSIESLSEGTQYWKYFIILALILLAVEIVLIRIHI